MTSKDESQPVRTEVSVPLGDPVLVEDVLLLLFQPDSGTIAGENILFYVLGGAVIADLALTQKAEVRLSGMFSSRVHAIADTPPSDVILEPGWNYIVEKPRSVQTVIAAIGPHLREPVLNRLIERGDLRRGTKKTLGVFKSTTITLGSDRRQELLEQVRAALVDGKDVEPRIAAIIALISASNTLPQFHREIPWSSDVYKRGKEFEKGNWGAAAAATAVTRTMAAVIANAIIASTVLPRS